MAAEENVVTGAGATIGVVRGIVWVILVGAILATVATLVFGGMDVAGSLVTGQISLQLIATEPLPPHAVSEPITLISGSFETANVILAGLPGPIGALAMTAQIVGVLSGAAASAVIALMGWSLVKGTVFRRSLATWVTIAGGILLTGYLLSGALGAFASMMVARELNGGDSAFWNLAGVVEDGGFVTGVVLLLVGLAFQYGEHLQRDSEGLV